MLNKRSKRLLEAYDRGYRVVNGIMYSPSNEIIEGHINKRGYKICHVIKGSLLPFHRLVAYQKYGDKIFEKGIQVRHLDNNKLNNMDDNIAIGSAYDNTMDLPIEQRSINAGNQSRKHPHNEIIKYHKKVRSYKKTIEKFGLSSKGTLNYILHSCSPNR